MYVVYYSLYFFQKTCLLNELSQIYTLVTLFMIAISCSNIQFAIRLLYQPLIIIYLMFLSLQSPQSLLFTTPIILMILCRILEMFFLILHTFYVICIVQTFRYSTFALNLIFTIIMSKISQVINF